MHVQVASLSQVPNLDKLVCFACLAFSGRRMEVASERIVDIPVHIFLSYLPAPPETDFYAKFEKGLSLSVISIKFIMLALIYVYLIEH